MIFGKELIGKVLSEEKTVTRRRLKGRDGLIRYNGRLIGYQPDKVYAVQPGRGKKHVGHILVKDVRTEALQYITPGDAEEEGFSSRGDFVRYWSMLYGDWNPDELVAVISFELLERLRCCAELEA